MTSASATSVSQRERELLGQIVVVIDGSAGIGLETACQASAEAADITLTGRNPDRLERAMAELGALPGEARALGPGGGRDAGDLEVAVPGRWMTVETTLLTEHPSD